MERPISVLLALAVLAHASGCVTKKVKKILKEETRVSLTVRGDADTVASVGLELERLYKVKTTVETVEEGVRIVRIIGAYAVVIDAIVWLIRQSLQLLANDEVSRTILAAAIAAAK